MLVYNMLRVAAILHNRLLAYDGYDEFDWENCNPDEEEPEEDRESNHETDGDDDDDDDDDDEDELDELAEQPGQLTQHPLGSQQNPMPFSQANHLPLKEALIKNLSYAYTHGKLEWPKHFTMQQRSSLPLLTRALRRTDLDSRVNFRVAPSTLRRRDAQTGLFTAPIGNGLFANKKFKPGDHLINFVGTIINRYNIIIILKIEIISKIYK